MAKPKTGKCSVCGEPSVPEYRPFCSKRCADIDLARWLNGAYVIAGGNSDADEDGEEPLVPESENTPTDH
ncbi:MAG: DNA gyrase inhibitor YacG [Hyphomicrobium sp.]